MNISKRALFLIISACIIRTAQARIVEVKVLYNPERNQTIYLFGDLHRQPGAPEQRQLLLDAFDTFDKDSLMILVEDPVEREPNNNSSHEIDTDKCEFLEGLKMAEELKYDILPHLVRDCQNRNIDAINIDWRKLPFMFSNAYEQDDLFHDWYYNQDNPDLLAFLEKKHLALTEVSQSAMTISQMVTYLNNMFDSINHEQNSEALTAYFQQCIKELHADPIYQTLQVLNTTNSNDCLFDALQSKTKRPDQPSEAVWSLLCILNNLKIKTECRFVDIYALSTIDNMSGMENICVVAGAHHTKHIFQILTQCGYSLQHQAGDHLIPFGGLLKSIADERQNIDELCKKLPPIIEILNNIEKYEKPLASLVESMSIIDDYIDPENSQEQEPAQSFFQNSAQQTEKVNEFLTNLSQYNAVTAG